MKKTICILPVRLDSNRFPNKVLQKINNITILDKMIKIAESLDFVHKIIIATDSKEIYKLYNNRIEVLLMKENVWCGSQRAFYVYKEYKKYDYYITLPCDEPLIDPKELNKTWKNFLKSKSKNLIFTAGSNWNKQDYNRFLTNLSCKIISKNNNILYFSRAAVPRTKDNTINMSYSKKHIGIFIFKKKLFKRYKDLPWSNYENSMAKIEGLEQTIFLENGFNIGLLYLQHDYHGIDTTENLNDLEKCIQQ